MPSTNHNPVSYSQKSRRKSGRVTSRLVKREQKKMTQQTLMITGLSVVVVILFIFAVVPGLIKLTSLFLDSDSLNADPGDTIPPRVPSISAPAPATHSASIKVDGFGEPDSEVVLVLNGSEDERQSADADGKFNFEVFLNEDANSISFYAIDKSGNESNSSRVYEVTLDSTPPAIKIELPQDGQQFELRKNQSITVEGTTEPRAKVFLNGRLFFARSDGSFSTTYQLSEGDNELKVKAIDLAGNQSEQVVKVSFRL
jgi:uncharacterized protein YfaP (DUF2135 family)